MKQTTKRKPQMGLTFEDVWALFQETAKRQEETAKRQEETDRQIKETHKQIGELGNKFGAVVEHMMVPNLKEKFNALGYEFGKVSTNVLIETKEEGTIAEINIFLENGDCAMAVEVKSQPTTEGLAASSPSMAGRLASIRGSIKNQCKRMERLRKYSDKHKDKRKLYGAMAGAIFSDNAKKYALKQGLYIIEQSGDTVKITAPSGENTAKAW